MRATGKRTPDSNGYYKVRVGDKQVREHVAVAERVLGKKLPPGALVHHADGDRSNNAPSNLVICPNDAYHQLLHQRMRALEACGHPGWMKCWICKGYSPPGQVVRYGKNTYHPACEREKQKLYQKRHKESRS